MKVLAYCPTYPQPPHVLSQSRESIMRLAGLDTLTFDMSLGKGADKYDRICWKYNRAREMFLAGSWDALLTVEADMIVPPDAVAKLAEAEVDIARGLYVSRHDDRRWMAYTEMHGDGQGWSYSDEHLAGHCRTMMRDGEIVRAFGLGLGCTLIRRRVLEVIAFTREGNSACDWWFSLNARRAGFRQVTHCGVVCGHLLNEHTAIYPDADSPNLYIETPSQGATVQTCSKAFNSYTTTSTSASTTPA